MSLNRIKQLKPSKQSRYKQGYIKQSACSKYINKSEPIIYRSSYEKKFMMWLESNPNIKRWGSECICIPYEFVDGMIHRYYPDYYVEFVDGTKMIVEIKPSNQTTKPVNENSWAQKEWTKNVCKWKATQKFCEEHGLLFKILTEKTISRL